MDTPSSHIDFKDFVARFKFIRKCKDPVLGEASLLKDTVLHKTVISQEKIFTSQSQFEEEVKRCEFLTKLNASSSITKFWGYSYKQTSSSHGKSYTFYQLREHLEFDIERETGIRLKNKTIFSEDEIWKMAQQTIAILHKLHSSNCSHGNIRPRTILLTKENDCKIHWSYSHQTAYQQITQGTLLLDSKCCLSPEQLKAYAQNSTKTLNSPYLSDVFSLGMTLLYVCTLGDIDELYNWEQNTINAQKLAVKLHNLRNTYSEKLTRLLEKMLKIDASERTDFWELENIVRNPNGRRLSSNAIATDSHTPKKLKHTPNKKTPNKREFKIEPGAEKFETYTIVDPEKKSNLSGTKEAPLSQRGRTTLSTRATSATSLTPNPRSTRTEQENSSHNSFSRSPDIVERRESPREEEPKQEEPKQEVSAPHLLRRAFSPIRDYEYRDNDSVLKEIQEELVFVPNTKSYKNGVIVKCYADGSHFEGSMKGKNREGLGIYYYINGDIYAGEWKDDKFHGRGIYLFANGERYEGSLLHGMKEGRGAYYYGNKNKYLGEWRQDKKNGKGAFFFYTTNETYDGDWQDGERHGTGAFYFATGDKFVGNWVKGEKLGKGIIQYTNGAKFEGEWRSNKPNGFGVMFYANGDKYQGTWENGMKSGKGLYNYSDGSKYDGEWANDDKEGYGEFYYTKGDKYSGEWRNGIKYGNGTYTYKDGSIYVGQWQNDLKHGRGTLTLSDGTKYTGNWKAGERYGEGCMVLPNGDKYEGKFQQDMMHGEGTYRWANGDLYQGEWAKNMMHGEGVFTNAKNETYKGIWNHQKLTRILSVN